jgi:SpoVK/Ycf46/Vps4 family AAA+-type ATPase
LTIINDYNICYVDDYKFVRIITPFLVHDSFDVFVVPTSYASKVMSILIERENISKDKDTSVKIVGIDLPSLKTDIIDFLLNEKFRNYCKEKHIKLKRGIVFYGPPGNGKTLSLTILKKIALENGIIFTILKDPEDFLQNRELYYTSKKSICVFEDFDAFLKERKDNDYSPNMILYSILNTLDGVDEINNVVSIFTTNNIKIFDSAFLRPGRIDKVIEFKPPTLEQIKFFLSNYITELSEKYDIIVNYIKGKKSLPSYALLKGICDDLNILLFNNIIPDNEKIFEVIDNKFMVVGKSDNKSMEEMLL